MEYIRRDKSEKAFYKLKLAILYEPSNAYFKKSFADFRSKSKMLV